MKIPFGSWSGSLVGIAVLAVRLLAQSPLDLSATPDRTIPLSLYASALLPMPVVDPTSGVVTDAPYFCRSSILARIQSETAGDRQALPPTLFGRPAESVIRWVKALDPEVEPTIIWTTRWTLVAWLPPGPADLTGEEWVRLRPFFPDLAEGPRQLTGAQRAHVMAIRLLRTEAVLRDLLGLTEEDRIPPTPGGGGYIPLPYPRADLVVDGTGKVHDGLTTHLFSKPRTAHQGQISKEGPFLAISVAGLPPDATDRKTRFFGANLLMLRLRSVEGGWPPWVRLGIAHTLERCGGVPRRDLAETLPVALETSDWDRLVRDLIAEGRPGRLRALSLCPESSLTSEYRAQSCTMVDFLLGLDHQRFGRFCRDLLGSVPGSSSDDAVYAALKAAYGHDGDAMEAAWKAWAQNGKPGR